MSIKVSKKAGFCMGVRKALEETLSLKYKGKENLCTLGPLIHNPQVLEILKKLNIENIKLEELKPNQTVIIRAHGVSPDILKKLKEKNCEIINCTCPRVGKVQAQAKKAKNEGKTVIIIGDKEHAEVKGIIGYAGEKSICLSTKEEAKNIKLNGKAVILAQTTFSKELYEEISNIIKENNPKVEIFQTICDATSERQSEAREMAKEVDAMVVVGGSFSANTKRLKEIIEEMGIPAYLVEEEKDLKDELKKYKKIGVTAGASTPNWLINRVVENLIEMRAVRIWKILWKTLAFLSRSNFLIFLSSLSLIYIISNLVKLNIPILAFFISPMFLFSFHTLNNFSEKRAQEINEPAQQIFIEKNKKWLKTISFIFLNFSIILSFIYSIYAGIFLFFASLLGILYLIPSPLLKIPCSKDLFTASAWAILSTWFYQIISSDFTIIKTAISLSFFFLVFLCRAIIYDLKDLQGDRMVGKETIPIYFGLKKSIVLFNISLFLCILILFLGYMLKVLNNMPFFWLFFPLHSIFYYKLFMKKVIPGGVRLNLYIDGFYSILGISLFFYKLIFY